MSNKTVHTEASLELKSYVELLKIAKEAKIKLQNQKKPELIQLILGTQDPEAVANASNEIAAKDLSLFQKELGAAFMLIRSKKTKTYRKNKKVTSIFEGYKDTPAAALETEYLAVIVAYSEGQEFEIPESAKPAKKEKKAKAPKVVLDATEIIKKLPKEVQDLLENNDITKSKKMRRMFDEGLSVKEASVVMNCHYSFAYGVKKRFDEDAKKPKVKKDAPKAAGVKTTGPAPSDKEVKEAKADKPAPAKKEASAKK